MMYLTVIFIPPLYFILRKRWGAFVLNLILYILAWATVFFFGIGFIFWALAVGHAGWHLRKELMREHAKIIAEEMVAKMKETKEA
jgi:uncharacterized membrane protein